MRASHEIGDDAFHRIEEELDWLEMAGAGDDDPSLSDVSTTRRLSRSPSQSWRGTVAST